MPEIVKIINAQVKERKRREYILKKIRKLQLEQQILCIFICLFHIWLCYWLLRGDGAIVLVSAVFFILFLVLYPCLKNAIRRVRVY